MKVIIIAWPQCTGNLWQRNGTLSYVAEASFLPSVVAFGFLRAPFLFYPHYSLNCFGSLSLSLPVSSSSYSYLLCFLFLFPATQCTELLWKSPTAGEGWTCLEIAATKARLSSVTRPLNLLWEFSKLSLSARQGEAIAPLFLLLMTQTGIASPQTLPVLGGSVVLCCPNPSVKTTATTLG